VEYANGDIVSYVSVVYECRVIGGALTPDGVESLEAAYVSADEAGRLPLSSIGRAEADVAFSRAG
jgi:hypothetical protein